MKQFILLVFILHLAACSFAPEYHRPVTPISARYKESGTWLPVKPDMASLDRGPWWTMYGDPALNALQDKVSQANQDIKAALARYDEARADLAVARSAYYPTALGVANAVRQQTSGNTANKLTNPLFNDELLAINFSYEVDLWGRVRNSVAVAKNLTAANAADLAAVKLRLHAELANFYFALRGADDAQDVLDQTVVAYQKALALIRHRFTGGADRISNVEQALNQLETAKTQAAEMHLKRAQLEHAIAILIGEIPAHFTLKVAVNRVKPVTIDPQLPSTLLERRPDIAEGERQVQAANANIGVARAAFFPAFNLSAAIGLESTILSNLLSSPSLVWALGPTTASALLNNGSMPLLTQVIFDGGKLNALSAKARSQYDETVANYRQTVLTAYQEVEDSLIALHQLEKENKTQNRAAAAARSAMQQALYRYKGGLTTYLDVVVAENLALQAELAAVNVRTRHLVASVQLIKALGGGWHDEDNADA